MKDYKTASGLYLRNKLKRLFLLISILTFSVSVFSVLQHWDYDKTLVDISKQLRLNVSSENLVSEIETAIADSQFDDARMYLVIADEHQYQIDFNKYYFQLTQKDTQFKRVSMKVSNFANGFIKGKSNNLAGLAGSVTADFTVVGDVRDLYRQYKKHEKGEDVNDLIVVLSGAGIGLTALTVGTLGTAAPAKAGTSLIKVAAKTQRISLRFQKYLLNHGRKIFDWPAFTRLTKQNKSIVSFRRAAKHAYHPEAIKPLQVIAKRVNNIRKSSSAADTIHLLKYVETSDDLRHLEKIAIKHGSKTKGLMKLLGKGAIRTVRVLRKTTGLVLSIVASIISALFSLSFLFPQRKIVSVS